jgi:hypothetical protein
MARRSRLHLAVVLALLVAFLPSVAAAAPERPPGAAAGFLSELWQSLVSLVAPLGSIMDPDGATSPPPAEDRSELGSTMDPNG